MTGNRRDFLKNVSGLAAGAGLIGSPLETFASDAKATKKSANDSIGVALIGCNGMGWANLSSMLKNENVNCVGICDVDTSVLERRTAEMMNKSSKNVNSYTDYRKLLDNKEVDAVIIGTPDHWHCLQMIHACQAGKHVYVEKPIGNSIEECNRMVDAKKRYGRVVQVGQWQRSDPHWLGALEYLRSGKLGTIRMARAWACVSYGRNFAPRPDSAPPPGVDYDMWLGPAPKRPFNPYRFHGTFRYFWDYAGGLLTDWGVHMIDIVLAGMDVSTPSSASADGGKIGFPGSAIETPDTLHAIYSFPKFTMVWEQTLGAGRGPLDLDNGQPGVAFTGNNGTLVINRERWEVLPESEDGKYLLEAIPQRRNHNNGLDLHTKNFVECIRTGKEPNCTIEMGRNAAITAQIGNIAHRLRRQVQWDEKTNEFRNDNEANNLLKAHYRNPWKLP